MCVCVCVCACRERERESCTVLEKRKCTEATMNRLEFPSFLPSFFLPPQSLRFKREMANVHYVQATPSSSSSSSSSSQKKKSPATRNQAGALLGVRPGTGQPAARRSTESFVRLCCIEWAESQSRSSAQTATDTHIHISMYTDRHVQADTQT